MDDPSEGEKEQPENKPEPEKADGATIHEFPKGGERVHLKTVAKAPPVPELRLRWGEDLQNDPVIEPKWIVKDYVAKHALNGFFGDGGVGKDFILMQLCVAMATGKPWFGMNVEPGRALYINVEDSWEMMRYRQDAIQRFYNVDFKDYPERFIASSMVGQSTVFATFDSRLGMIKPTGLYDNFRKVLAELRPDLIVVGNRVNIFGVNQNEDAQARQCLELLNALILEFNTTIIMPGHVSNYGMTNSTGSSGSVQWSNGTRHRVWMSMDADAGQESELDENEKRVRVLEVKKTNYSAIGTKKKIAWDDRYGLFVPIEEAKGFEVVSLPASEKNKQAETEFLRMLDLFVETNTAVSDSNKRSPSYAPRIMAEDRRCKYHKKHTKKQNYDELEDAMRRLKDRGEIDSVQYGPPSADTWKLVRK